MLVGHRGASPKVDPSAYVAPTAVLCGEYGVSRDTPPRELMQKQADWFAAHRDDRVV